MRRWSRPRSVGVRTAAAGRTASPRSRPNNVTTRQRQPRLPGRGGDDDHQIDAGRHDIGGHPDSELPAEAKSVDPGAIAIEPGPLHLTWVGRESEATDAEVGGQGDQPGREDESGRSGADNPEPGHGHGAESGHGAEGQPTEHRPHHEPRHGGPVAMTPTGLGERGDRGEHRHSTRGPCRPERRHDCDRQRRHRHQFHLDHRSSTGTPP